MYWERTKTKGKRITVAWRLRENHDYTIERVHSANDSWGYHLLHKGLLVKPFTEVSHAKRWGTELEMCARAEARHAKRVAS